MSLPSGSKRGSQQALFTLDEERSDELVSSAFEVSPAPLTADADASAGAEDLTKPASSQSFADDRGSDHNPQGSGRSLLFPRRVRRTMDDGDDDDYDDDNDLPERRRVSFNPHSRQTIGVTVPPRRAYSSQTGPLSPTSPRGSRKPGIGARLESYRRSLSAAADGGVGRDHNAARASIRRSTSIDAGGGSSGNTPSHFRSSRLLTNSIVRRSAAFARFSRSSSSMDLDNRSDHQPKAKKIFRRYVVGDSVLILTEGDEWSNQVNKFGYPPGEGTTVDEQRGPYLYVLGKVKTVHFEEYSVYYTITREDTRDEVRGENDTMEPITSPEGEDAARKAAQQFARERVALDEFESNPDTGGNVYEKRILENVCIILFLPLLWLYDCFVFVIGNRLFEWGTAIIGVLQRQALLFLNGMKPYEFSATITTVDLIVLCSTWYMFIDQARLAFFPTKADDTLAYVNFTIWTILVIELIFEVFIRPDGYYQLIVSDKAFTPTTVRFISGLHLIIESISLAFFIPEFICLFGETSCDGRPKFSFLNAAILAVSGSDRVHSLAGRAFYACIRLRVFGLVRHWKNMWVHNTFLKKESAQPSQGTSSTTGDDDRADAVAVGGQSHVDSNSLSADNPNSASAAIDPKTMATLQKERDAALINASNIGTALMVTNSYRALFILCATMGLFPMISLIFRRGVTNPVTVDMIQQLQATNRLAITEDADTCRFLVSSVETWIDSWTPQNEKSLKTPNQDAHSFLLSLVIQPSRCVNDFNNITTTRSDKGPSFVASEKECNQLLDDTDFFYEGVVPRGNCTLLTLDTNQGDSPQDNLRNVAKDLNLRVGAIKREAAVPQIGFFQLEDESIINNAPFTVVANFNHSHSVLTSALCSFLLQLCLLVTVLGGLSVLRKDAEDLVLAPLRSMLKIVARYAKNPLASARSSEGGLSSEGSDSDSDLSGEVGDGDNDKEADGFGNYETEQLITAVSKITDLLRKCWGVAGADIISTNLASREGALAEVFNPTVPGKSVYALFAFAAINGFDHALKCLGGDVMILINDVAYVLHGEVFRWGFGDSGQCNKNLGAAFLMVFRIGLVKEVVEKLEEATNVVFSMATTKKLTSSTKKKKPKDGNSSISGAAGWNANSSMKQSLGGGNGSSTHGSSAHNLSRFSSTSRTSLVNKSKSKQNSVTDAMQLSLQSLPGIATFTDRAVIGMLKSFAGIHRDNKLRAWSRDFRLSAGVGTFSVDMIFGMDAGWAVEGAVGSEYKIDATYLSPHVNMASRMMSACKHYGVTILLSEAVQELMSDVARSKLRNLDRVTVKGSSRIQKIFTYDARSTGADFFLFSRSDEQADLEAERYMPSIWNTDQDLSAMRHHVTDDFEQEYTIGMKSYYDGDWTVAIEKLEEANEIMVEAAMEEGYLHDELDDSPDRKELYRAETADGPSVYLVQFMKSQGGVAPDKWAGWHPLLSK